MGGERKSGGGDKTKIMFQPQKQGKREQKKGKCCYDKSKILRSALEDSNDTRILTKKKNEYYYPHLNSGKKQNTK